MTDVQHVETAIRKRNRATFSAFSVNRVNEIFFLQNRSHLSFIRFSLFVIRFSLTGRSRSRREAPETTLSQSLASSRQVRPHNSPGAQRRKTTRLPQSRVSLLR